MSICKQSPDLMTDLMKTDNNIINQSYIYIKYTKHYRYPSSMIFNMNSKDIILLDNAFYEILRRTW